MMVQVTKPRSVAQARHRCRNHGSASAARSLRSGGDLLDEDKAELLGGLVQIEQLLRWLLSHGQDTTSFLLCFKRLEFCVFSPLRFSNGYRVHPSCSGNYQDL